MAGFISRFFGGKKKEGKLGNVTGLMKDTLEGVLQRADLDLNFEIDESEAGLNVEIGGNDEELLREKEGQLIDSLQFFVKRAVQHQFPDERIEINFDSNGFREESSQALIELADRLKAIVIEKNKSVYFRALPPKDRKVIHQYLAGDERVKSKSIGDGLYKKIKIYPASGERRRRGTEERGQPQEE